MFAPTCVLLVSALCVILSADDGSCVFQWAVRIYEKLNHGLHSSQPLANRKSIWKNMSPQQWGEVQRKEKLISSMKHVQWPAENGDMYQWYCKTPVALQGLSESFLWHFIHIVAADEDLEKYFKGYNKLFRIYVPNADEIRKGDTTANKFQGVMLQVCFDVLNDATEEEWLDDFQTKSLRGLIFGNVPLLSLMKKGKNPIIVWYQDLDDKPMGSLRQGFLDTRISRMLNHFLLKPPVPMFNEWNIRVAHFLGALKFHILDTRQESSYGQKLEEISAAIVSVNPTGLPENRDLSEYIKTIYRNNETEGPFRTKAMASILLKRIVDEETHYYTYRPLTLPPIRLDVSRVQDFFTRNDEVRITQRAHTLEQRKEYYVVFETLIEYADITMFMIDTEPMRKILENVYKAADINERQFKTDLIDFIDEFISIVTTGESYVQQNVRFYKDRINNLCNYAFCASVCYGYPEYWYPNRVLLKAIILARSIVKKLPHSFLTPGNIERNYQQLNDLFERRPLEALIVPNVYRTIREIKLIRQSVNNNPGMNSEPNPV